MNRQNIFDELVTQINDFLGRQKQDIVPITVADVRLSTFHEFLLDTKILLSLKQKHNFDLDTWTEQLRDFLLLKGRNLWTQVAITASGILSFKITQFAILQCLTQLAHKEKDCGELKNERKKKIDIEVISANPTGFLHIGHLRNGVIGRAIGGIYRYLKYDVKWSYLSNDSGEQVRKLALSVYYQLQLLLNPGYQLTEKHDIYQTAETELCAKALLEKWQSDTETKLEKLVQKIQFPRIEQALLSEIEKFSIYFMHRQITKDLKYFHFEDCGQMEFFSEQKNIREKKKLTIDILREQYPCTIKYIYTDAEAVWLRTSRFGDEKDRVLVKKNHHETYFLMDLIYHLRRASTNTDEHINIWGSDHHGYIDRIKAGILITNKEITKWKFVLVQMLKIQFAEKKVKMSKRFGTSITLEQIFSDAPTKLFKGRQQLFNYITFFLLEKSTNVPVTLNFENPMNFGKKNNFIYTQYCYVRVNNILKKIKDYKSYMKNYDSEEAFTIPLIFQQIVMALMCFPLVVNNAKKQLNPTAIVIFVVNIVKKVHFFYEHHPVLKEANSNLRKIYILFLNVIKNFFDDVFLMLNLKGMEIMDYS